MIEERLTADSVISFCKQSREDSRALLELARSNAGLGPWAQRIWRDIVPKMENESGKKLSAPFKEIESIAYSVKRAFRLAASNGELTD